MGVTSEKPLAVDIPEVLVEAVFALDFVKVIEQRRLAGRIRRDITEVVALRVPVAGDRYAVEALPELLSLRPLRSPPSV